MFIQVDNYTQIGSGVQVSLVCPKCKRQAIFEHLGLPDLGLNPRNSGNGIVRPDFIAGQRRCPNPDCKILIFFIANSEKKLVTAYPPEHLDFDTTRLPRAIVASLEEAITCHANQCWTASAIMVRKTLEELCKDKGATGKTLFQRIKDLGTKIVISQALLTGLDNLRLLGNDAAHIESEVFSDVGHEEVTLAIDVTKEVLKSVYQHDDLVARLEALKKSSS